MKMPTYTPRAVEAMGTHDAGAVRRQAHAIAGVSNAQAQVMNHMAKVSAEFIERKEKMEDLTARSNVVVKTGAWTQENSVKEYWTAEEVRDLGLQDKVRTTDAMTMVDGSTEQVDRERIPKFEVYHFAQSQFMEGLVNNEVKLLSNNIDINNFNANMSEMKSEMTLRSGLEAAQDQRRYESDEAIQNYRQAAITGNLSLALDLIEEGPFDDVQKQKFTLDANQTVEWGNDSDLLENFTINPADKVEYLSARLAQLQDPGYLNGKPMEFDEAGTPIKQYTGYFGRDKNDGPMNREAAINRFQQALKTTKGGGDAASKLQIEEYLRAIQVGKIDGNPIYGPQGGDIIRAGGFSPTVEAGLLKKRNDYSQQGDAVIAVRTTHIDNDKIELARRHDALQNAPDDGSLHDDRQAEYEGQLYAMNEKQKQMDSYPAAYVNSFDEGLMAISQHVTRENFEKAPEAYAGAWNAYRTQQRFAQQSIGVMPEDVKFLGQGTVADFKQIAAQVNRDPDGVPKLMASLDGLLTRYPGEENAILSQLIDEGALEPEHTVGLSLKDPSFRQKYFYAVANKEDIEKSPAYKVHIKEVRESVINRTAELASTLFVNGEQPLVTGGGDSMHKQLRDFQEGLTLLTMSNVTGTGVFDSQVLEQYSTAMIDDNWHIEKGIRIPKGQGHDIQGVMQGVYFFQEGEIELGEGVTLYGQDFGDLSPEDNQRRLFSYLRMNAVPNTNGDESGVRWFYRGGQPVIITKDGKEKQFQTSYEDLTTYGKARASNSTTRMMVE